MYGSVLDSGQGVDYMRETCNTGSEGTANIGIDECHLSCLIVVLVMHILNQVQGVYIETCKPIHHLVVLLHNFIEVKDIGSDGLVLRTYLHLVLLIDTTVDSVEKALSKVCTCAEELHLLTGLGSGYTAADAVIIAPDRTHYIIVLILDGAGIDGDLSSITTEVLRQSPGVENSKVGFRRRSHVFKSM